MIKNKKVLAITLARGALKQSLTKNIKKDIRKTFNFIHN